MRTKDTPAQRFWSKVEFTEFCWLWQASNNGIGYGKFHASGGRNASAVYSHRWAYEFCVGPIPQGLTIDHLCRVTNCVNPDHLEPVTIRENILRGPGAKTHCLRGHEFTPDNTMVRAGARWCRKCQTIRTAKYLAKKAAR